MAKIWDPTLADYEGAYTPALDVPLDTDPELMQDGPTDDYCVVHLQRLANPLLPYDPVSNPYLTIDSMSSDLTTFNGVTADSDPTTPASTHQRMTTRERGRQPGRRRTACAVEARAERVGRRRFQSRGQ